MEDDLQIKLLSMTAILDSMAGSAEQQRRRKKNIMLLRTAAEVVANNPQKFHQAMLDFDAHRVAYDVEEERSAESLRALQAMVAELLDRKSA